MKKQNEAKPQEIPSLVHHDGNPQLYSAFFFKSSSIYNWSLTNIMKDSIKLIPH